MEGRLWIRGALSESELSYFDESLNSVLAPGNRLARSDALLRATGETSRLSYLVRGFTKDAKPVRFVAFNKTPDTNWSLPWHQDRVIAVREKSEVEGFSNWSRKTGIWHCEPPLNILEKMIFVRVYLDSTDEKSGCLEIALGSHKYGKVLSKNTERIVSALPHELCVAKRGDVLLVKALTVHRSALSHSISTRRVIRIDYSQCILPTPLEWNY